MKYLLTSIALASMTLAGCSTMAYNDEKALVVDGQPTVVKVINIPSFNVEIAPHKAICDVTATDGTVVKGECLQYRQPFQKNYITMSGDIQGFTYEPGYRYLLDVRQEAVANEETGVVKPVWILNDIISKTSEQL